MLLLSSFDVSFASKADGNENRDNQERFQPTDLVENRYQSTFGIAFRHRPLRSLQR